MGRLICVLLLIVPLTTSGQFTYILDQSIPVRDSQNEDLPLAWAGGLNAAQFNTMDLNADGVEDLVLYDRMANKVITFLASENEYLFAPEYQQLFPEGIYNWLLLRDYNCDGQKDIFTGDILGIKVFRNISSSAGKLEWEQHLFSTGFDGPKSNVLLTENPATQIKVNLQLQFDDLPSISDVDGDGDLDILNIQYAGHTIEFHQNLSAENNLPCDSLQFTRVTRTWGNFRECHCREFAFNGDQCTPQAGGRTQHAGGKSLLAIDFNGDQIQDLLFSEAECSQLFGFVNEGSGTNPVINNFSPFPPNHPANFVIFPAAYFEDVDFDGRKDLIATPNIFSREFLNSDLSRSTWFYKNTGTSASPSFSFIQPDLLQNKMIDVGDNAVPAFADYDGDGDFDMLISNHSANDFTSRVSLYENTGTPSSPEFTLRDGDYLGFSNLRFFNVKIQTIDLTGDGTTDLAFTATSFDTNLTHLYFLPNSSSNSLNFNGTSVRQLNLPLTSTENVYLTDVNADGLPDVLAGRSEGNLEYWRNNGVAGDPSFVLDNDSYLGLGSSTVRQNLAVAAADLNTDGKVDLVMGEQSGNPIIVSDYRNAMLADDVLFEELIFNRVVGTYTHANLGGRIRPAVVNLFGTNKPAIVFGNVLGGLHILKHDEGTSLPKIPQVNIYPNPALKSDIIHVQPDRHGTIEIISILGQRLSDPFLLSANEIHRLALPPLAAGMYLVKFTSGKSTTAERLIVR